MMLDLQKMLKVAIAELDRDEEQEKRQAARAARSAAQAFLKNLDLDSQEGMWFEAMAEKFPSRLEAAVAYLRDVKR